MSRTQVRQFDTDENPMSKRSRQRQNQRERRQHRSRLVVLLVVGAVTALGGWLLWSGRTQTAAPSATPSPRTASFHQPTNFAELFSVRDEDLPQVDIALMNLLCAEGLRGADNLDVKQCLQTLDGWAKHVEFETKRHLYRFNEHKADFENSEARYRMEMLTTVLQQDLGVHYNLERAPRPFEPLEPNEVFFANSQNVFLHGLAGDKHHGTCSSMPVLVVAVGRRLGYPLKLVAAKNHLFVRWEDGRERFNVEATTKGFVSHPDEYYRQWPEPMTAEEQEAEGFLKSLTPAQEFAVFLSIRGFCCEAMRRADWAVGSFSQAAKRHPECRMYQRLFARAERVAVESGVVDKRAALLYQIRRLELPDGPMRGYYAGEKARLQALLLLNAPGAEESVATEFSSLEAMIRAQTGRR
jgi:hypothetical protein